MTEIDDAERLLREVQAIIIRLQASSSILDTARATIKLNVPRYGLPAEILQAPTFLDKIMKLMELLVTSRKDVDAMATIVGAVASSIPRANVGGAGPARCIFCNRLWANEPVEDLHDLNRHGPGCAWRLAREAGQAPEDGEEKGGQAGGGGGRHARKDRGQ